MANTLKNIKKRYKKKKLRAQKAKLLKEQQAASGNEYKARLSKHRYSKAKKTVLTAAAVAGIVFAVIFYMEKRSYHDYKTLQTSEQEDIVSTKYEEMAGKILRYSPDSISLVSGSLETVWSETCAMQNPVADVNEDKAVVADVDGNTIAIFDREGLTGTVTTSYTIVKATISSSGLVAAILDGGDETWINFYGSDGSLIAENQTKLEDPGYPMDVAISDDGTIMMVAYQFVDGGETTSYVAFYNFGDVGQNEDDRIVSGYTYDGVVVPQVEYLGENQSVALRDDGFTLYDGKQIPKEGKTVKVEKEIVSTFFDDEMIGLVFKNDKKDKLYTMEVYSASGKLKFKEDFNIPYTEIEISDGNILMYNSSQMCVMNSRGVVKYSGTVDGTIHDFFKLGWNRYLLVLENGVNVIKFS